MYSARRNARTPLKRHRNTVQSLGGHTYALPDITQARIAPSRIILGLVFMPLYTLAMVLAPLRIREKILSLVLPNILSLHAKLTHNQRKLLLQHVSGRVLDVGSGSGSYLQHLEGKASHIVCLEPLKVLHPKIMANAKNFKDYQISVRDDCLDSFAEIGEQFDWVILGNVLCEVPNVEKALNSVNKLLKPGGYVYFCEHYASPPGTWFRRLQHLGNPIWHRISGGCNCNRDTLYHMEGMHGFDLISWELNLHVAGNSFAMGLAKKVEDAV